MSCFPADSQTEGFQLAETFIWQLDLLYMCPAYWDSRDSHQNSYTLSEAGVPSEFFKGVVFLWLS